MDEGLGDGDEGLMMEDDEYDEMGDFIVDEGPGGAARARRKRQQAGAIPGITAAMLDVRACMASRLWGATAHRPRCTVHTTGSR